MTGGGDSEPGDYGVSGALAGARANFRLASPLDLGMARLDMTE